MDTDAEKGLAVECPVAPADISAGVVEPIKQNSSGNRSGSNSSDDGKPSFSRRRQQWIRRFGHLTGVEARGIERVEEHERYPPGKPGYLNIFTLYFSANLTANNIALGLLGPLSFNLSLFDSAMCCAFGGLLGAFGPGYVTTFGPLSGNRTLVFSRYTMGYWPSKAIYILQLFSALGYGIVDLIITGQLLSSISGQANMSVVVGIIVAAVITWVVAAFGMRIFHLFERYAHWPVLIVLFVMIGVAGPKFDTDYASEGSKPVVVGNRVSYFLLNFASIIGWSSFAADWFVYYPASVSRPKVIWTVSAALTVSLVFSAVMGIGLGAGVKSNADWAAASDISSGDLMVVAFQPLGAFGKIMAVILAMSLVSNNIPGMYSTALTFQMLGRWFERIPRFWWTAITMIVCTAAALGGRNDLYVVFQNLISLMGYWVSVWLVIIIEEEYLFHRRRGEEYDWSAWNDPRRLTMGLAAATSFGTGVIAAVIGMKQPWYTGPVGWVSYCDLGLPLAIGWTCLIYPCLRSAELRYIGR